MELWLRYQTAHSLEWDQRVEIASEAEWRSLVYNPKLVSSILWPVPPLFPLPGRNLRRRHPHEINYANDAPRNHSYRKAAKRLAADLDSALAGKKVLVYAPLRGALPLWLAVSRFLNRMNATVYYPVTSSFVFYPPEFKVFNRKGRNASGRYNHILELKRLTPFLRNFDALLYLDEIVSGGTVWGYLKDMLALGIHEQLPLYIAGIADRFGERSQFNRGRLAKEISTGRLQGFIWAGCEELITEDQKFLLGIHYADYESGLNVIPVLNREGHYFEEKQQFEREVFSGET